MSNDYLHCLQGPNDETWQQALDRFASFCLSLHEFVEDGDAYEVLFDEYYQDGTHFEWEEPVATSALQAVEVKHQLVLPAALKALFGKRFAIYHVSTRFGRWGERRLLQFNAASNLADCLHPLCKAVAWNFGPYFAEGELSTEQVAHLDASYFGFGRWSDDDHRSTYLLVDRHGGFGRYEFDTENYPQSVQALRPLLDGQRLTMSLDELLTGLINKSMISLLARNEVPGGEPGQELS